MSNSVHICSSASPVCYNPFDSYGMICVGCNCCGKIDKAIMYQCRIATDKRQLIETANQLTDKDYQSELQQRNILLDIEYSIKRIRQAQADLKGGAV